MSTTMPEFEMPDVVPPPPVAADAAAPPARASDPASPTETGAHLPAIVGATELTAEPDPLAAPVPAPRPRIVWRHVLAAALVGAILGAGVPAAVQAVDRAAAAAEIEGVRSLAADYLAAIAEGRADDATALAPSDARRPLAPPNVLAAARPIERTEVRLVHLEGDQGSVEVRYRAGGSDVFRTLDVERRDGRWSIATTLLEEVNVYSSDDRSTLIIAGTTVESGRVLLYPGTYVPDSDAGPVLVSRAESFVVDGDPRTPTETYRMSDLAPELSELAMEHALAAVAECQRADSCEVPDGEVVRATDQVHIVFSDLERGRLDLSVPLTQDSPTGMWLELQMRLSVDADGRPLDWLCGRPGQFDGDLSPCPAIG